LAFGRIEGERRMLRKIYNELVLIRKELQAIRISEESARKGTVHEEEIEKVAKAIQQKNVTDFRRRDFRN